jgi:hypothetical protein
MKCNAARLNGSGRTGRRGAIPMNDLLKILLTPSHLIVFAIVGFLFFLGISRLPKRP